VEGSVVFISLVPRVGGISAFKCHSVRVFQEEELQLDCVLHALVQYELLQDVYFKLQGC